MAFDRKGRDVASVNKWIRRKAPPVIGFILWTWFGATTVRALWSDAEASAFAPAMGALWIMVTWIGIYVAKDEVPSDSATYRMVALAWAVTIGGAFIVKTWQWII